MRNQLEEQLRQRGELPAGLGLGLVRAYVDMHGRGEIWLSKAGLPVRQRIHLQFPAQENADEWLEAQITTSFSNWDNGGRTLGERFTQLWQDPLSLLNGPTTIVLIAPAAARRLAAI